ncbi:monocarboxylate transporter 13-like [Asterias amurensis]|uniref:monocarboxylate transporter 13-like n=1 Tax=Asterias amurensis TaxID=7602 RepID=UPI003AB856D6
MEGRLLPVFTSFMVMFLELGVMKSLGVLFNPMLESLECTAGQLGVVIGLGNSIGYIISPITVNFSRCYGTRVCMMIGSVFLLVGYLTSAFVTNVFQLSVTIGITTGVGMGMSNIPQLVVLVDTFTTQFPLVFGIALVGGSLGAMACPPVVDLLIGVYGWRGTMMIIAATMFSMSLLGALQKPPRKPYSKLKENDENTSKKSTEQGFCDQFEGVLSCVTSWLSLHIFFEERRVVLYLCATFLLGVTTASWILYLVPHAEARGISPNDAAFLATGGGVGNVLARVVSIPLLDRNIFSPLLMFEATCLVNAVAMFLDIFAGKIYMVLLTLASVNGACIGLLYVLFYLVAKQIYDERHHADLLVFGNCFFGVGQTIGTFIEGSTYDLTHSYDTAFLGLAAVSVVMVLLTFADGVASRRNNTDSKASRSK